MTNKRAPRPPRRDRAEEAAGYQRLGTQGSAPHMLNEVDSRGRPMYDELDVGAHRLTLSARRALGLGDR